MTTITRERLECIASWRAKYSAGHNVVLPAEEAEELARIALASLEAEAVAYIIQDSDARSRGEKGILRYFANISDEDINEYEITVTPLYTAPPAPVMPDVVGKLLAILDRHTVQLGWGEKPVTLAELVIYRDGSDELVACRAAMLNQEKSNG